MKSSSLHEQGDAQCEHVYNMMSDMMYIHKDKHAGINGYSVLGTIYKNQHFIEQFNDNTIHILT